MCRATLAGSSLGAALAIRAARAAGGSVSALVRSAPSGLCGVLLGAPGPQRAARTLLSSPLAASLLQRAGVAPCARDYLRSAVYADARGCDGRRPRPIYAVAHQPGRATFRLPFGGA